MIWQIEDFFYIFAEYNFKAELIRKKNTEI